MPAFPFNDATVLQFFASATDSWQHFLKLQCIESQIDKTCDSVKEGYKQIWENIRASKPPLEIFGFAQPPTGEKLNGQYRKLLAHLHPDKNNFPPRKANEAKALRMCVQEAKLIIEQMTL